MILLLLVKPALVLGVALIITACLRHHTAAARHAMWAGAILATLALPLLSVTLPPLRVAPRVSAPLTRDVLPPRATTSAPPSRAIPQPAWRDRDALAARLPDLLLGLWIAGVMVFAGRRIGAEIRLRRIVRRARPFGHRSVLISAEISAPAVAGTFRPVVLLPAAATTWAEADLKAVLAHELAHIARRDGLFNLCGDLVKAIYWCNPAVHLAVRRMRAESERACDDRALLAGSEPESYALLLLAIARTAHLEGGLPGAATAMARPRELESRLLAVLDPRVRRAPSRGWMPVALATLAIALALPAAAITLQAAVSGEPDTLGDSLASPLSERLPLGPDPYRVTPAMRQALGGPDSVLARTLIAALNHRPEHAGDLVRDRAAWALSQARDGRLVEPLLAALTAPDWRVQAYAAWALAVAHDPRAVPSLIPLLGAGVWRLRAMAAAALRHSLDARAEAAMHAALTDPAWQVRVEAVEYFAALGGPMLSARLGPRLEDRHVAVRLAAERALTSQ